MTSDIVWKDGRAFAHYSKWECVQQSFWRGGRCAHDSVMASQDVLEGSRFVHGLSLVYLAWPISSAVHMTNAGINRRAWLGRAACFVLTGNCIECTTKAWFAMSEANQVAANEIANHWINSWLKINSQSVRYQTQNTQLELAF